MRTTWSLMAYTVPSLWPSVELDEIIQGCLTNTLGKMQAFLIAASTLLEPSEKTRKSLEQHPSCLPCSYGLPPGSALWELNQLPNSAGTLCSWFSSFRTACWGSTWGMKDNQR